MVFRHDRGHDGIARSMLSRRSIVAMLPVVMPPTWAGMVMQSPTAEEDALAEAVAFFWAFADAEAAGAAEEPEEAEVPEEPASAFRRSYSSLVMVLPSASV